MPSERATVAADEREEPRFAALFDRAPDIAAAIAFLAGAATVISIAAPGLRHIAGLDLLSRFTEELPELSASIGGVALMGLAPGLRRRVDTAWAGAVALLAAAALYAFFRHEHLPGALVAATSAGLLAALRPAFYRHSRLSEFAPGPRVAAAMAAALAVGFIAALLWTASRPGFAEAPWWSLLLDDRLGRAGRIVAAGVAGFGALLVWRYLIVRPRASPAPPADGDLARAEAMIASAEESRPDAHLAFVGDKSFLFADSAFVMAARGGGSLIAMGGPVGKRASWRASLLALRREAENLSLNPVIYSAPPELLPDLIDSGFRVEKIGENAIVPLAGFTLAGGARQNLRTARRRIVEREGGAFEVHLPPHEPALLDQLQTVSDAWLAMQGGAEKSFSLGRFDRAYLARQPLAIVRQHGKPIAFANIWTTPDKSHAALDLMRYDPDAPAHGLMDFLITEILLWAQREHYGDFDLGMAPLAGLADDEYARLFQRIGRIIYARAEPIYGFQGLRQFKEKFGPRWEPRYLAAPGSWTMPLVLAEVGVLTSGGVAALLKR